MKRLIATAAILFALTVTARVAAAAPDEYDDTQSHPLRLAAYLLHPVGFTAEWLMFRPFHYLVSQPYLDRFFGHRPHEEVGNYRS